MRLLAKRLSWPDGALETCWDLERRFPDWHVAWLPENTRRGFEHPASYWATHDGIHKVEILEPDVKVLAERLAAGPPEHDYSRRGCEWCLAHLGNRRVRI
jgi:hypothetical protein